MRIYTDEKAKGEDAFHGPLYNAIVKHAREQGIAGATVLRGVVGFGIDGNVQRASILDLSGNLPLTIELVDEEGKLRDFFRSIHGLKDIGLVTLQPVEVLHYDGGKPIGASHSSANTTSAESEDAMQSYQVRHRQSGDTFYVLAENPTQAIEKVTLQIADMEGVDAWTAAPATPPSKLERGCVLDKEGKPVKTMMV